MAAASRVPAGDTLCAVVRMGTPAPSVLAPAPLDRAPTSMLDSTLNACSTSSPLSSWPSGTGAGRVCCGR